MACEPTAQPRCGPTIWIEASAGIPPGTVPDGAMDGVGVGDGDAFGVGSAVALGVGVGRTTGGVGGLCPRVRSCHAPTAIRMPATSTPPAIANAGAMATGPCGRGLPCRTPVINTPARSWRGFASRRKAWA